MRPRTTVLTGRPGVLSSAAIKPSTDDGKKLYRQSTRVARTLYDCTGENPDELSFEKGEFLFRVIPTNEPGWVHAHMKNGMNGIVPLRYIEYV